MEPSAKSFWIAFDEERFSRKAWPPRRASANRKKLPITEPATANNAKPDRIFWSLRCEKHHKHIDSAGDRQSRAIENGSDEQTGRSPANKSFEELLH